MTASRLNQVLRNADGAYPLARQIFMTVSVATTPGTTITFDRQYKSSSDYAIFLQPLQTGAGEITITKAAGSVTLVAATATKNFDVEVVGLVA